MLSYFWPVLLIVGSNVIYHICAKSVPEELDPMASLTVTYLVGAAFSALLFFVMHRGGSLLREYAKLNWAPFAFGIALVGLEAGFIYAYKAGWQVGALLVTQSAILAAILLLVGFLMYREPLTANKLIGVVVCMVGLYIINR